MSKINWDATDDDTAMISDIVDRVAEISARHGNMIDKLDVRMSVTACHLNGCPLDLERLVEADDFNLMHDVGGIHNTVNHDTGMIDGLFRPRFARREPVAA